jgi:3-oxoacyl-[acyl-carrier protein] reductase
MTRTAVVTGASRGIGKAIAEEFAQNNYNVALLSRHYDAVEEVARELGSKHNAVLHPYKCDVSKKDDVAEAFAGINHMLGSIDVLVNNAGINSRKSPNPREIETWFGDFDGIYAGWIEEISTNLTGTYICSYFAAGYMIRQKHGSIINISSIKGKDATASPGYGASKAGIIHLTKDYAKALSSYGIRINCIVPGFIDTGLTQELPADKKNMYKAMIPQARFGTAQEIAKVAIFLASDNAGYITGAAIDVDGGYLVH